MPLINLDELFEDLNRYIDNPQDYNRTIGKIFNALVSSNGGDTVGVNTSGLSNITGTTLSEALASIDSQVTGGGGGTNDLRKIMENGDVSPIPAGKPLAKLANGKVVPADSDAAQGQAFCGVSQTILPLSGTGTVLLPGANVPGAIAGLGYLPGQDVYLSETGGYTNDPNSFTGGDDSIIKLGIADCAAGVASALATDLVMFSEVLIRP